MSHHTSDQSLEKHLDWFQVVLDLRMKSHFEESSSDYHFFPPPAPALNSETALDRAFRELELGWEEKVIILLALVPYLRPQLLDVFFINNSNFNRGFTEFGGIRGKTHNGFLPTRETAVFIIAGNNLKKRMEVMRILRAEHLIFRQHILEINSHELGDPPLSAPLNISKLFLPKVLWNEDYTPEFGSDFPAQKVETNMGWDDLVLAPFVMEQVQEVKSWITHELLIQEDWGLKKMIKAGFRSLFFGPPGTGKTLTASLLGKALDRDVYRIDLAMVISKYIGETEKNLAKVFDLAEHSNWILFFDEADALFGKRSLTNSSNDRYANQEVSYLLQRIEDFPGLIILASNFKGNLDEAFTRRFQSMIHFPMPTAEQRLILWQKAFSKGLQLSRDIDLEILAEKYEVTGGEIINVLRYAAIRTAERAGRRVLLADVIEGLNREFQKSGKVLHF